MEDTINKRLGKYIDLKKVSPPDVYKKLGVRRQDWSGWMNSGNPIPLRKVQAIVSFLSDVNARWLLTGEGDPEEGMTNADLLPKMEIPNEEIICDECSYLRRENAFLIDHNQTLKDRIMDLQRTIEDKRVILEEQIKNLTTMQRINGTG